MSLLRVNLTSETLSEPFSEPMSTHITKTMIQPAVTKSGTGTWGLGRGTWDVGRWTRGRRDAGTRGRGDAETWGPGDVGHEHARGLEDVGRRDWRT